MIQKQIVLDQRQLAVPTVMQICHIAFFRRTYTDPQQNRFATKSSARNQSKENNTNSKFTSRKSQFGTTPSGQIFL